MKKINRKYFLFPLIILLLFNLGFVTRVSDNYFEISKNLDIFGKLFREVNALYVDETDPTTLMRTGIDAMLQTLDPYTSYIGEQEIEDYRVMSTGQYGGIGAVIGKKNGKMVVLELYEGYPADKSGMRVGDELIKVKDKEINAEKMKVVDVRNLLRGDEGSEVNLFFNRTGKNKLIELNIKRDKIWVKNVPYYGMINDEIGYISLTGFSKRAAYEVQTALQELKIKNRKLKGIILDLRGNPGGRLDESVKVANVFLPQDEIIVQTKGRSGGTIKTHRAHRDPIDTEIPLAVLVNDHSASASEIVAGAIQDLDRGLIIGQKSFGKGLVQNIRPLSYNTQLKVTTAKYYTPSGRCIQALNYTKKDAEGKATRVPDSLRQSFKTKNARIVLDGGGIEPDIHVEKTKLPDIVRELKKQGFIFDFATLYANKNKRIAKPSQFKLPEEVFNEFVAYVNESSFSYETETDQKLDALLATIETESYASSLAKDLKVLDRRLETLKDKDLKQYQPAIMWLLKQEIVSRYYFEAGKIKLSFNHDKEISKAVSILSTPAVYHKMLQPREP